MKQKRPVQKYDMVEVWWDDATEMPSGWIESTEPVDIKPCLILSVGFLVKKTKTHVVIAIDTHNGGHNGRSQIPLGMVRKLSVLRKKD